MNHVILYAQITGYACWAAAAWALMTKAALLAESVIRERRRRRNARRLVGWRSIRSRGSQAVAGGFQQG